MPKVAAIIPARYASSRLPGKPLIDLDGKSLVQRVYEQVKKSKKIDTVIIATDDDRIVDHIKTFDGVVVKTGDFASGTDRIAYVAQSLDVDYIINVQGDEPLIDPASLDLIAEHLLAGNSTVVTLCTAISTSNSLFDYNTVKLVKNQKDQVLYFSRQAIPAQRDIPYREWLSQGKYWQHIGVYGFQRSTLIKLSSLPISTLEKLEQLEQLRWMESGYEITCVEVAEKSIGVDTQSDLEAVLDILRKDN